MVEEYRDYSVRLDAPEVFKFKGEEYSIVPLNEAKEGEVGYYVIGETITLEVVGTEFIATGPDFSSALNALRAEMLRG